MSRARIHLSLLSLSSISGRANAIAVTLLAITNFSKPQPNSTPAKVFPSHAFARTSADGLQSKLCAASIRATRRDRPLIAQDDPQAAIRFGDYLVDRAESLANFPELGSPYHKRPHVRRLLCKPYLIYYRLRREEQVIEVMDFWHSARREFPL